jgi:hypothetical protein
MPAVPSSTSIVRSPKTESAMAIACVALATAGCVYTPQTTVRLRDPSGAGIDIEDEHGKTSPLLPPAANASAAPLPSTSPPFAEGLRPATTLKRRAAGAIDAVCDECDPEVRALVAPDGTIEFDSGLRVTKLDWTKSEMRIRFRDIRTTSFGTTAFDASLATPWANVAQVRRVSTPNRAMGLKLLLSAGVTGALGGFALQDGVSLHHSATTVFGIAVLPVALALATGGAWYAFAPPQETILYGDK